MGNQDHTRPLQRLGGLLSRTGGGGKKSLFQFSKSVLGENPKFDFEDIIKQ
jgi:hypothetical protein